MIHAGKCNDLSIRKMMEKNMKLSGIFERIQIFYFEFAGFCFEEVEASSWNA